QYLIVILLLALVEPGYSISTNYISELGIGSNALIFTLTMVIWGVSAFFAAIILYRVSSTEPIFPARLFAILIMVAGIGVTGSGLVPMYSTPGIPLHFTLTNIGSFSALIAIFVAYKLVNPPFSYVQIIFAALGVLATILLLTGTDMGLGLGGMERLSVYIFIVWLLSFSTYLMNKSQGEGIGQ
ncbi:MAG: DUF998 domain-containing protein, partial [Candidatus Thorarchaeota archaeon]